VDHSSSNVDVYRAYHYAAWGMGKFRIYCRQFAKDQENGKELTTYCESLEFFVVYIKNKKLLFMKTNFFKSF
jgi:hypothetical protein